MLSNTGWHVPPFWQITFKHGFYDNKRMYYTVSKGQEKRVYLITFATLRLQCEPATRNVCRKTSFKYSQDKGKV